MTMTLETPTPDPFAGPGMRAASEAHAIAPFQGVPTMDGNQADIAPAANGYAYLRIAPLAGNPLLQKICNGVISVDDLPKERDRTGICAIRRNIYPFLSEAQKELAMARHKKSPFYREGSDPNVWAGDTLITLDTGVAVRCHLLIELVKDARQAEANDAGDSTADEVVE